LEVIEIQIFRNLVRGIYFIGNGCNVGQCLANLHLPYGFELPGSQNRFLSRHEMQRCIINLTKFSLRLFRRDKLDFSMILILYAG
jgi:hypothetical protein